VDDQIQSVQLPALQEHDFQSNVPIAGPLIQTVRRVVYGLAARWGVLAVIQQQNQINQLVAQHLMKFDRRLEELDARLIDQDHDLAHLARVVAEVEIHQRYLAKRISSSSNLANQSAVSSDTSET
jgi:uncharacterized coiled-coil protein SlyX